MRRFLAGTGRVLVTLGILILLFVAYQLWGTGIYTARAQNQLEKDFQAQLAESGVTPTSLPTGSTGSTTSTTVPVVTTLPPVSAPDPAEGDVLAHLVIPKIGLDAYVVNGTADSDLRKGPGHYPATPLPGQLGNSGIAGHRTTYGAPFGELDSLEAGDVMQVTTLQGNFEYRVYEKIVVSPSASEVLDAPAADDPRQAVLTLTTCHPKYSAAERLIVKGELVVPTGARPLPSSVDQSGPKAEVADPLSGETGPFMPTILAGIVLAIVGGLWWLLFHRHPRWTTWLVGVVPFAVALGAFYYMLERALPSNY